MSPTPHVNTRNKLRQIHDRPVALSRILSKFRSRSLAFPPENGTLDGERRSRRPKTKDVSPSHRIASRRIVELACDARVDTSSRSFGRSVDGFSRFHSDWCMRAARWKHTLVACMHTRAHQLERDATRRDAAPTAEPVYTVYTRRRASREGREGVSAPCWFACAAMTAAVARAGGCATYGRDGGFGG